MAQATAEKAGPKAATKFLVWYGTLPAGQPVEMRVPTRERDPITREFYRIEKTEPYDLWNNANDARVWVGKCRFFQSLAVRGFVFPAFSEAVQRGSTNENEISGVAFPGAVQIMKQQEIDRIVKSCYRHVVRFPAGNADIMSMRNHGQAKVLDLDHVAKPPTWTDAQWVAERQRIPMEGNVFDADTDVPVAEFVYLHPIEIADFDGLFTPKGSFDVGACLQYLPHQRLDRKFFGGPIKSVAEAFPQALPKG